MTAIVRQAWSPPPSPEASTLLPEGEEQTQRGKTKAEPEPQRQKRG